MKKLTLAWIMLLSVYGLKAQTLTPNYSNVDYVGNGNTKQMLDIYIPQGINEPTATIVHIHGGAFMMGSKGVSEQPSFQTLYNNGYICVDINYRLSTDTLWPAQVHDCKAAIRYLKANADLYQIDTCKIGVIGESAGGYLVSMLGTTGQVSQLEGLHLGNGHVTSRVHAVVDLFGPINFLTMDEEAAALGFTINTNSPNSPESRLMGAAVQTIPELVTQANPTTYITDDDAAFFISAGSIDQNIPYTQGQNFCNALVPVVGSNNAGFELIAGAGHGGSFWHNTAQDAKYLAFFNSALTGCAPSGASSEKISEKLFFYPNPVSNILNINLPENNEFTVEIYNSAGQIVLYQSNMTEAINISCENIPCGMYILKAISPKHNLSAIFVKQ